MGIPRILLKNRIIIIKNDSEINSGSKLFTLAGWQRSCFY